MANALSSYFPSILVDIYLTATHRFATQDFYDASGNYYKGNLIKSPNMDQALSDLYYGVQPGSSLVLQFSNRDNQIDNTWDEIVAGEEIRGEWIKIQRHDPTDGTSFEFRGKITKYVLGDIVSITIEMRDDEILDTLLPLKVITTDEFTTTALNLGEPVNICFGRCRNVPLRNIQNSTGSNYYDYLIGYGTIESLWVDHANGKGVKRDGVLVTASEYTFYDGSQGSPFSGYAFIRFTTEQRNFSGGFHNLTADVFGLELGGASANRNFATCIKYLLNDATWGLNDNIDATSFSTAATALDNIGNIYCNGAITSQRQARDILHDLLFPARANIQRAADGEWEITVDEAGASVANFGDNDGFYNNCEVLEATATPARIALKKAIVHYELDPYNEETPYKEMFASVHSGFGVEKTYDLPFVKGNLTAERILSYLKNRSIHSDERVKIQAGMEARDRAVGEIITLTAPRRNISAKEYKIDRIVKNFVPAPKFILDCREYSSSIYDNETLTKPTDPDSSDKTVTGPETWVGPITLGDGVNQSAQITLMPPANLGDVYIAAKNSGATFDWPNWEVDGGFILGLDDSDSDKTKFFIGDSGNYYFKWDGLAPLIKAANFELDASGNITVSNITATGGTIGGWTIAAATLSSANIVLDDGNDKITVNTLTIDGANDRIRSGNYVSGFAGAGFTLEPDLLEVGNIACRGIFRTAVFQKDIISIVGGNVLVTPGDVLATDMTAADASILTIEGNETFAVGDILRIKDGTDDEWLEITNIASAPTYTVTRDKASQYGANANPTWTKGACVANYQQSGDGAVYMTASETNAPYLSIFDHAGSPWTTINTRFRIGNLNGFLGYSSNLYGIAIGETEKYLKYDSTNGLKIKGLVEIIGAPALQNMLMNGGFEETDGTNAYYWRSGAGITTETSGGDDSNKYLKIVRSGSNKYSYHQNPDSSTKYFEVNEGEIYEFGGSVKSDGTCASYMQLFRFDKDKSGGSAACTQTHTNTLWETKSCTYTVVGGDKFLRVVLGALTADGWAAFDNVYLKRVDEKAWSFTHASDRTKIDGGNIYAASITLATAASDFSLTAISGDLDDIGNGTTYGKIALTGITGGKIIVAGLDSGVTARMFLDGTTKTNIEAWRHASDVTLIDGGDIYTSSITGDKISLTSYLSINSNTFGADGIQLQYNAGNPRFYCGDGSNNYFQFDGTNVTISTSVADAIIIKNGADIKIEDGGDINMIGDDTSPSQINFIHDVTSFNLKTNRTGSSYLSIIPTTANAGFFHIGYDGLSTMKALYDIQLLSYHISKMMSYYSASQYAYVRTYASPSVSYVSVYGAQLQPTTNKLMDLGTSSYAFDDTYSDDFHNVADFFHLDTKDDLITIKAIKGSGIIDERTGLELIDDNTIPEWMLTKYKVDGEEREQIKKEDGTIEEGEIIKIWKKGDIARDPDGKPYLSTKMCDSLSWGAIRQLDAKIQELDTKLEALAK